MAIPLSARPLQPDLAQMKERKGHECYFAGEHDVKTEIGRSRP